MIERHPAAVATQRPQADGKEFREAMSRVCAAVHIVTTDGGAGLGGLTATAMTSIAADPPTILVCVGRNSASAERMIANGVFCVNALAPADEALADVFAGRTQRHLDERFKSGTWTKLETGAPVLVGAAAVFDCRLVEAKPVSTHFIMIGAVEAVAYGAEGESLAYLHRRYRAV